MIHRLLLYLCPLLLLVLILLSHSFRKPIQLTASNEFLPVMLRGFFSRKETSSLLSVSNAKSSSVNSVSALVSDMIGRHEGRMSGVPSFYNWIVGPRIGMGNSPGSFRWMTAWGQIYREANASLPSNTRVEIRNIKAYVLRKSDNRWYLLQQSSSVEGSAFREDYANNQNILLSKRNESGDATSIRLLPGYNFHFWPATPRARIQPGNISGMYVTFQARLISDNSRLPDDRSTARILAGAGGDYWLNESGGWNGSTNADFAIGKMKFLTTKWQSFNAHTLDSVKLRINPPPLE